MAARRNRTGTRPVSARTAKRRAQKRQQSEVTQRRNAQNAESKPETMAQARAFDRKKKRYRRLGLCQPCAAQAAWGHQLGFGDLRPPCTECLPIVAALPDDGPRGSKWRKCLIKVEYLTRAEARELGLVT